MAEPLKILIIDNKRDVESYGSWNLVHWALKTAPTGSTVIVRRAPDQDLPADKNWDAVIISGSRTSCMERNEPWIASFEFFIEEQIKKDTPILGVCYGHQSLARCLAKLQGEEIKLGRCKDAELGWQTIQVLEPSGILEGFTGSFVTFQSHYEEVQALPPGTRLLASTDRCPIQAFEVIGKPVFGIQFHPEAFVKEAEETLAEKLKKGERRDWILNAGKGPKLYSETVGDRIFGNFFRLADAKR